MRDAMLLAIGTLTRVPVPPPRRVDRSVARTAMLLAPVVGLVLGLVGAVPAQVIVSLGPDDAPMRALLIAALALGALAWLTRAIHLDGLADTADALGSGRPPEAALQIARRSDIGPFGVVTLVLVLLAQVSALAALLDRGAGGGALVVAVVTGRLAIVLGCLRSVPAARPDGLGATVAGSVPISPAVGMVLAWVLLAAGSVGAAHGGASAVRSGAAVIAGLVIAALLIRTSVRRLGGITGDVLGAAVELATTAVLVILVASTF